MTATMIENTTTKSLEGFARARHLWVKIKTDGRGTFWIVSESGLNLNPPKLLGRSRNDAELTICKIAGADPMDGQPTGLRAPSKPRQHLLGARKRHHR